MVIKKIVIAQKQIVKIASIKLMLLFILLMQVNSVNTYAQESIEQPITNPDEIINQSEEETQTIGNSIEEQTTQQEENLQKTQQELNQLEVSPMNSDVPVAPVEIKEEEPIVEGEDIVLRDKIVLKYIPVKNVFFNGFWGAIIGGTISISSYAIQTGISYDDRTDEENLLVRFTTGALVGGIVGMFSGALIVLNDIRFPYPDMYDNFRNNWEESSKNEGYKTTSQPIIEYSYSF